MKSLVINQDYSMFSPQKLDDLISQKESEINEIRQAKVAIDEKNREDTRVAMAALAQKMGYSVDELYPSQKLPRKVKAKRAYTKASSGTIYTNPANETQTWNGNGRPPKWFKQALTDGATKESMSRSFVGSAVKISTQVSSTVKGRVRPKKLYVNPNNPSQTWGGYGPKTDWLAAELAAGKPLELFLAN